MKPAGEIGGLFICNSGLDEFVWMQRRRIGSFLFHYWMTAGCDA